MARKAQQKAVSTRLSSGTDDGRPTVMINALNIRPGGGLSVLGALLSRMTRQNLYVVVCNDRQTLDILQARFESDANVDIRYVSELASRYIAAFLLASGLAARYVPKADLCISLNHYYTLGVKHHIVYHVNVLRFRRPSGPLWKISELADRARDSRARMALKRADANVFESRYLHGLACERHQVDGRVIYIGVEQAAYTRSDDAGMNNGQLLAVTSPQPHKDNETLLHVLADLLQRRPDVKWRLVVAGGRSPSAFQKLRSTAEDVGVAAHVEWVGFASPEELAILGRSSLCLLSASRVESFCMVALESMSWGCPPVVVRATAMPESVGDAGFLVEPGDVEGFTNAVLRLQCESGLREEYCARGYRHLKSFSWDVAAAHFNGVVEAVLNQAQATQ